MIRASRPTAATWVDPARAGVEQVDDDFVPVGSVHDPEERSAEDMAAQALSVSDSYVRRSATADIDGLEVSASALERASRGGRGLDDDVRGRMEAGFDADFGDVRIHEGAQADDLAKGMSASAFTTGSDIFFAKGQYDPGTPKGDHMLAHELAHTVQQGGSEPNQLAHRFPAEVLSAPISWAQHAGNVFRPGEGASGGVYIVSSQDQNAPVKKVVVKPVFGQTGLGTESPEQLAFGDLALARLFGLRAPKSRMVKRGPEFNQLVQVCQPHQPAKDPEDDLWRPMVEAEGFVVMAEVPKPKSIGSLVDTAPTNQQASADLMATIFNHAFLTDLGRLCIADMLLGNDDRIVLGAMNLGNVMVSITENGGQLHAIDTTAKLKPPKPSDVASHGGGPGGRQNMKKYLTTGSGQTLDDFIEVLVDRIKRNTPDQVNGNDGPPPLWQVVQQRYADGKRAYQNSFDTGWSDMIITALELSMPSGERQVNDSLDGLEHQDLSLGALRTNIAYIAERSFGGSHEQAIGRPMAIALVAFAKDSNRDRLEPPANDALAAGNLRIPGGSALSAEYARIPGLPTPVDLSRTVPGYKGTRPLYAADYELLQGLPDRIAVAHGQVDMTIGATKKRGLGRKEVPRNRSLLGHAIVDAVASSAGGNRLGDSMTYVVQVAEQLDHATAAKFNPTEASQVAGFMDELAATSGRLQQSVAAYKTQLAAGASAIKKTKMPEKAEYADKLTTTARLLDITTAELKKAEPNTLRQFAKIIRRSNRDDE